MLRYSQSHASLGEEELGDNPRVSTVSSPAVHELPHAAGSASRREDRERDARVAGEIEAAHAKASHEGYVAALEKAQQMPAEPDGGVDSRSNFDWIRAITATSLQNLGFRS